MKPSYSIVRGAAVAVSTFLFIASASAAQSVLSGFEPIDQYILEVDGEVDEKAEIFVQRRLPAFLVLPSGSNSPYMLGIRNRMVQSVNLMKVTSNANGTMDLAQDAMTGTKGALQQASDGFSFSADGKRYQLKEKPDFLGLARGSSLEEYADRYKTGADAYTPDAEALDSIRNAEGKVHVRIYFGSWCPFCQRYVPHMVRVAKEISEANVTIDFYGLPKGISSDPVASQARISSVPTGVVFVDGKEVGRLMQDDWRSPEKTIAKILERAN